MQLCSPQVCAVRSQPSEQCTTTLMPSLTAFAINAEVSSIDLTCRNQPLPSTPDRNAFIDGTFNSHATQIQNTISF